MKPASIHRLVRNGTRATCLFACSIAALLAAHSASAALITWDISPGSVGAGNSAITGGAGTWDEALGNWTLDAGANNIAWVNANNDTAVFGGTAGAITLGTGISVGGLTFKDSAGYVLNSDTLTFGTAGAITTHVNATINSIIAGTVAITKTGAGSLSVSGINTYNGTLVSAGSLLVLPTSTLGVATGTLTVDGPTAIVDLQGNPQTIGAVTLKNGGQINSGTLTAPSFAVESGSIGSVILDNGSGTTLTKTSAGTLTLTAANTFAGQLTVEQGYLKVGTVNNVSADGVLGNSALSVILGKTGGLTGTLQYTAASNLTTTKPFTLASGGTGAFQVDTSGNILTLSGLIDGGGALAKTGPGTLALTSAKTYTGATTVTTGILTVDLNTAAVDNVIAPASALVLAGGTLNVIGTGDVTARTQTFNGTTFSTGASTLIPTLATASTTANALTLDLGVLTRTAGGIATIVFTTGNTTATNTQLTTSSGTLSSLITDANGVAFLTFGTSATNIRDWAAKDASNTQIVQAPASGFYTAADATTIAGNADIGALSPIVTGNVGDNAVGSIRFDNASARTLTLNNNGGGSSTFSLGGILVTSNVGNFATVINGTGKLQGPNNGTGDLCIQNWDTTNNLTISASIGGSGGLTKGGSSSGNGIVILTGTNTYTGPTTVASGILYVGTSNSATGDLGNTTGPITIGNGSSMYISRSGTLTIPNDITAGSNTTGNGSLQTDSLFQGTLNLNGAVNLNGPYSGQDAFKIDGSGTNPSGYVNINGTFYSAGTVELKHNVTVNVNLGATATIYGEGQLIMDNSGGSGASTLNVYGTLNLSGGGNTIGNANIAAVALLHIVSGGVVNVTNGRFIMAGSANAGNNWAKSGTLTMDAGSTMTLDTNDAGQGFVVQSGGTLTSSLGTVNLNGGVLTTGRIIRTAGKAIAVFNFNGGTLKSGLSSTNFLSLTSTAGGHHASSRANVRNGGAFLDTNSYAITIPEPLLHSNVSGDLATDGGLTLSDGAVVKGVLTLSGANTYNGPTVIGTSTLKIGGGATLQGGTYANSMSIASTGVFDYNSSAAQTLNGGISGDGSLLQEGAGTLTLNGDNSYTGGTTISAGVLVAGHSNALGFTGAIINNATLAIGSGVTLARLVTSWGAASVLSGSGTYTPGGTFTLGGAGNCQTLSPGIGTGGVGTLTIGNALTLSGTTLPWDAASTSSYDSISVQGDLTLSNITTVAAPALAGGTYNLITYTGSLLAGDATNLTAVVASGAIRVGAYSFDTTTQGFVKMSVQSSVTNSLTWSGAASSAWTVPSPLNWSGGDSKFYNGDTVTFDNSTAAGGTVTLTKFSATVALQPGAVIVSNDATHPYTFSGDPISGTGTLTKSGGGTLTLSSANSYTGNTIISDGTVVLGNAAAIPTGTGFGNVVLDGGATVAGTLDLNGKSITLNGLAGISGTVVGKVANNNATAATLTVGNNNAISSFAGNIANGTGTISLLKLGTGTQTLSGANTLLAATVRNGTLSMTGGTLTTSTGNLVLGDTASTTGNFTLSDGTVNVAGNLNFGNIINSNGTYTQSGGTVNVATQFVMSNGSVGTYNPESFTMTGGQFNLTKTTVDNIWISNAGGTSTITVSGGTFTSASTGISWFGVRGPSTLNVSNSGVCNLAGSLSLGHTVSSQTNSINLGDGTNFSDGTSGTLAATTVVRTSGTGTLNFNGGTLKAKVASTTFMTGLTNAFIKASGAIVDTNTFDITIGQALLTDAVSTGGGLTKNSAGKLTLGGVSTYTGATKVNGGTLALDAVGTITPSSGVTLVAGAVLDTSAKTSYALPAAQPVTLHLNGSGTGSAGRLKAAGLDITNAAVVFSADNTLDDAVYVLADYTGLTGTAFASVTPPTGYTINYGYNGSTQIALVAVPFGTWAAAKGLTGVAGSGSDTDPAPAADPDHDGRSNLEEFAFDGNPRSGTNDGKVVSKVATLPSDGSKVLTLTVPVRRGASFSGATEQVSALIDGVIYTIQGSATLDAASWTLAITEITNSADVAAIQAGLPALSDINADSVADWIYRTFRTPGTLTDGSHPHDFIRGKVVQP